jgi:uncharacterized damage-inducible protein DinB
VILHDRALREMVPVWRRARAAGIRLPATEDPSYASLAALLHHVLGASRRYMTWLCEKLVLPDPAIDPAPEADRVEHEVDRYLEHLLARWRLPLKDVEEPRFFVLHETNGEDMSCEAMLEHAVTHPMRHRLQLEELLEAQGA